MEKKQKIGIMGGTFDPIHYGHLVTAEAARQRFNLERVYFVPSGHPPHKQYRQVTSADHRLMLCILATVTNPHFIVSEIEIQRQGFSYTYDTVREFKQNLGLDIEIYFITGADAVLEIMQWKNIHLLAEECNFIAATRPGYHFDDFTKAALLPDFIMKKIQFMEVPALAISSTDVRKRVKAGESIRYLLPETVEMYIRKNRLYLE